MNKQLRWWHWILLALIFHGVILLILLEEWIRERYPRFYE